MTAYYQPGRYFGRVKQQQLGQSKEKKTPFFALTFEIIGQVDLGDPDAALINCACYDRTVFLYLTEKTRDYVVADLARLGYNKPSLKYLDLDAPGAVDFTGREVELCCDHEPYNGDTKEKWGIFRGGGALSVDPLDKKDLAKLDGLFARQLKEVAAASVARQTQQPAKQPAPRQTVPPDDLDQPRPDNRTYDGPDDMDIPF